MSNPPLLSFVQVMRLERLDRKGSAIYVAKQFMFLLIAVCVLKEWSCQAMISEKLNKHLP